MKLRVFTLNLLVTVIVLIAGANAWAQSTDASLPTPVTSNELSGRIKALDLGDARLTRHFYAFEGNPGDLLITIDSKNLNGDIDVFTAITFRPLIKTSLYASSNSPEVTKGIYLRTHQILILRVEARTPSDEPGSYHIKFGGTFERFSGGIPVAEAAPETEEGAERRGSNQLSSVGATLPKPPAEIRETAEAKPSPSPEKVEEQPAGKPAEKPAEETPPPKKTSAANRRTNTRPPPRRSTRPAPAKTAPKKTETAKTEASKEESSKPAEEKPEKVTERATPAEKPKTQEVLPGARLIVEQKDGTRIDRPMSTVRRVVVEGTVIVITLKTGKIERIPMADVTRMSIEPQ